MYNEKFYLWHEILFQTCQCRLVVFYCLIYLFSNLRALFLCYKEVIKYMLLLSIQIKKETEVQ